MSYIKKAMGDNHLFKNYTLQSLLDELNIIERYRQPGQRYYFSEITKKTSWTLWLFVNSWILKYLHRYNFTECVGNIFISKDCKSGFNRKTAEKNEFILNNWKSNYCILGKTLLSVNVAEIKNKLCEFGKFCLFFGIYSVILW